MFRKEMCVPIGKPDLELARVGVLQVVQQNQRNVKR